MNAKPTKKEKENNVVAKLRNLTAMIRRNSVKPFSFRQGHGLHKCISLLGLF